MSRSTSSSSSPVVTATSSSFTMGATWAPVSSSSPGAAASSSSSAGRCSAGSAMAFGAVASAAAVGLGACACWLRSCYRLLLSVAAEGRRAHVMADHHEGGEASGQINTAPGSLSEQIRAVPHAAWAAISTQSVYQAVHLSVKPY